MLTGSCRFWFPIRPEGKPVKACQESLKEKDPLFPSLLPSTRGSTTFSARARGHAMALKAKSYYGTDNQMKDEHSTGCNTLQLL
jgi:hypothetical protein